MKTKRKIGFLGGQKAKDVYLVEMTGDQLDEYRSIMAQIEPHRDKDGKLPTPKECKEDYDQKVKEAADEHGVTFTGVAAVFAQYFFIQNTWLQGPVILFQTSSIMQLLPLIF